MGYKQFLWRCTYSSDVEIVWSWLGPLGLLIGWNLIDFLQYVCTFCLASAACLCPSLSPTAIDARMHAGGEGEHAVHPRGVRDGHGSFGETRVPPSVWGGRGLPRRFPGSKQVSFCRRNVGAKNSHPSVQDTDTSNKKTIFWGGLALIG